MHVDELTYPQNTPPHKFMLQNRGAVVYMNSFQLHGAAVFFLPTSFYHTIVKELTSSDIASGVLTLGWLGFCQNAFPAEKTELTLIDYMGYAWKLSIEFSDEGDSSCVFSGE